jgi:hypothetical protein
MVLRRADAQFKLHGLARRKKLNIVELYLTVHSNSHFTGHFMSPKVNLVLLGLSEAEREPPKTTPPPNRSGRSSNTSTSTIMSLPT